MWKNANSRSTLDRSCNLINVRKIRYTIAHKTISSFCSFGVGFGGKNVGKLTPNQRAVNRCSELWQQQKCILSNYSLIRNKTNDPPLVVCWSVNHTTKERIPPIIQGNRKILRLSYTPICVRLGGWNCARKSVALRGNYLLRFPSVIAAWRLKEGKAWDAKLVTEIWIVCPKYITQRVERVMIEMIL